jgi:prevent-host-death family protein
MTREGPAAAGKTHLARLLDEVERGETIIITRRGRRIARIVPDAERRHQEVNQAIDNIIELGNEVRKQNPKITIDEILSSIHEGHRY